LINQSSLTRIPAHTAGSLEEAAGFDLQPGEGPGIKPQDDPWVDIKI
jgi:hypothetical protein